MEVVYEIYRDDKLVGLLTLPIIREIYGSSIIVICNPVDGKPFVIVE